MERQPGIVSILSMVPPVWPRPRPAVCGTAAPHAATSGTSTSEILSPTPPVECLSTVGRPTPDRSARVPVAIICCVQRASSGGRHPAEQDRHQQGGRLLVDHLAAGVGADEPVDLLVGERPAVPLGEDQIDGVHARLQVESPCRRRPAWPSREAPAEAGAERRPERQTMQVVGAEGVGEQLVERAGVEEELGAAVLVEQLAAAPAGDQRLSATVDAGHRDQATAAGGVQRRHQPALGAEREPVRRVLDVARGEHPPVVDQPGHADRVVGVGHVGPRAGLHRRVRSALQSMVLIGNARTGRRRRPAGRPVRPRRPPR